MGRKATDLTGQKFGKLTATGLMEKKYHGFAVWLCSCECGGMKSVPSQSLLNGGTTSCGCTKRGARKKPLDIQEYISALKTEYEKTAIEGETFTDWLIAISKGE